MLKVVGYDIGKESCNPSFKYPVKCKNNATVECCACSPDQSSRFPYKCQVSGDNMPDCYLAVGKKRYLVECRCNIEPGSKSSKEPQRFISDVENKFNNSIGFGAIKLVVIPKELRNTQLPYLLIKKGWSVEFCDNEICCACQWCS